MLPPTGASPPICVPLGRSPRGSSASRSAARTCRIRRVRGNGSAQETWRCLWLRIPGSCSPPHWPTSKDFPVTWLRAPWDTMRSGFRSSPRNPSSSKEVRQFGWGQAAQPRCERWYLTVDSPPREVRGTNPLDSQRFWIPDDLMRKGRCRPRVESRPVAPPSAVGREGCPVRGRSWGHRAERGTRCRIRLIDNTTEFALGRREPEKSRAGSVGFVFDDHCLRIRIENRVTPVRDRHRGGRRTLRGLKVRCLLA